MEVKQIMTFAGFVPVDDINPQGTFMSSKPLIIQLLGQSRSGKDWTAEQLKQAFEYMGKSVAIMSYAAPMKRITMSLFDITWNELDKYKNSPSHYSLWICTPSNRVVLNQLNFRTFLQRMGNEAIKSEFGDAVWADLMKTQIDKSSVDVVIIPDCRFTIELERFPEALTIRVLNRDLPPPMQHASELELMDFVPDYFLDNTAYAANKFNIHSLADRIISRTPVFKGQ